MSIPVLKDELLESESSSEVIELLKKYGFSAGNYYELGLSLGLHKKTMDDIEKEHKKDATKCLLECLKFWLKESDDVNSNGGPTIFALNRALLQMGEDKVANWIHKEKHHACIIFSQYEEKFKDALPEIAVYLHSEGIICENLLPPTLTENVELMLDAVRKGVCLNHHNLEKLSFVFQRVENTTVTLGALGTAILEEYKKEYNNSLGYWITHKLDGDVDLHLSSCVLEELLDAIRENLNRAIDSANQAMKEIPPIMDLRRYLSHSNPTLKSQLEECRTNGDILLKVVRSKCTLSNIGLIENIVNQFKVEAVRPAIDEYRASVENLFNNLPIYPYLHRSTGKVTLLIDRTIDDSTLNDIKSLMISYASRFDSGIELFVIKEGN